MATEEYGDYFDSIACVSISDVFIDYGNKKALKYQGDSIRRET